MILDLAKEIEKNADKVFMYWAATGYNIRLADLIERTFPKESIFLKLRVLEECEKRITRRITDDQFIKGDLSTTKYNG
jgi:hypothetical protein